MIESSKSSFSYEGDGLSISINPEHWIEIANLAGDTFSLTRKEGRFADAHSFDKGAVLTWGVEEKYIEDSN